MKPIEKIKETSRGSILYRCDQLNFTLYRVSGWSGQPWRLSGNNFAGEFDFDTSAEISEEQIRWALVAIQARSDMATQTLKSNKCTHEVLDKYLTAMRRARQK